MTINIWNILKKGGFIMTPYAFAMRIGVLKASILGQILSEFNHAHNNNLTFYDDFLFNPMRMSHYLGLTQEALTEELNALEDMKFINVFDSDIEDTMYMRVNQKEIVDFRNQIEHEYMYGSWDDGLLYSQNPIHKQTHFCSSIEQIKNYLYEHMKEPKKIPLVLYSYASSVIEKNKKKTKQSILNISNIMKDINVIANSTTPRELFERFVSKFNIQED